MNNKQSKGKVLLLMVVSSIMAASGVALYAGIPTGLPTPQLGERTLFPCLITNVVDGDTYDVSIATWEDEIKLKRIRLLGFNTPEMHPRKKIAEEKRKDIKSRAIAARDFVITQLESAEYLYFEYAWDTDNFGRPLGTIIMVDKEGVRTDIIDALRKNGHGKQ